MNYRTLKTGGMMVAIFTLSLASLQAQKINFSIKDIAEAFKTENQCNYCTQGYQFSQRAQQITNALKGLDGMKPKRKVKKLRRLEKALHVFIDNATLEHQGLSEQLAFSKAAQLESTITDVLKLKGYLRVILHRFDRYLELTNKPALQDIKTRLLQLHQAIENTVTQLKKQ